MAGLLPGQRDLAAASPRRSVGHTNSKSNAFTSNARLPAGGRWEPLKRELGLMGGTWLAAACGRPEAENNRQDSGQSVPGQCVLQVVVWQSDHELSRLRQASRRG